MTVDVIAFDAVETLFSLAGLDVALEPLGGGGLRELWFTRLLRDAFALTAVGDHRPFAEVADGALAVVLPSASEPERRQVLDRFSQLDAHPDARPALEVAAAAGIGRVILTNGSEATTRALAERNGLDDLVDGYFSVDQVRRWKPAPEPYLHVAAQVGVEPQDLALVAVHGWDIDGAHRAGLVTGWCARLERSQVDTFAAADVTGTDLVEVVAGLIAR